MTTPLSPEAARVLADALSYPDAGLPLRLWSGADALPLTAALLLRRFAARLGALGPAGAEELYAATFDLRPAASPYASHHLLGDGPRRNALLAYLAGRYREAGLGEGRELPDHFAELLRYLAVAPANEEAVEIAGYLLAPAARVAAAALDEEHPYRDALEALLDALAAADRPRRAVAEEAAP